MNCNKNTVEPNVVKRIISVWYRHFRVYTSNFISNAFPPFFEPLIFLFGLGIGFGQYVQEMDGMPYRTFLATGLIVSSSMYTAMFECTYGTFIRLEFDKVYDGMLGAPLTYKDIILGELLFVASKGAFFSFCVLSVVYLFGIITYPLCILSILVGFLTGAMFGALSMAITAIITNINYFNFYFTGFVTPMFFFSGIVFPIDGLPSVFRFITEVIPLTHLVRIARSICVPNRLGFYIIYDLLYCLLFFVVMYVLAKIGLKKRMIS